MKILFVGLSNKPGAEPFDSKTNSGKVLDKIISSLNHECFKRNLVNYAPLNECNKLRYPTKDEVIESLNDFVSYVEKLRPDLIISFGNITSTALRNIDNIKNIILYEKHPSYIYVYKRRYLDEYIINIIQKVADFEKQKQIVSEIPISELMFNIEESGKIC